MGCYIWYSEEGPGQAAAPPSPLLAVPNVTAHPSTASVPITVLLYDGPLLCGFDVAIKGLKRRHCKHDCVDAQVYSIGPTFVERVMCRIVEQVAEEICRLFQCVPKFSASSAVQVFY